MVRRKCARCGKVEHLHDLKIKLEQALAVEGAWICHRFEPKAPLWMRILNKL